MNYHIRIFYFLRDFIYIKKFLENKKQIIFVSSLVLHKSLTLIYYHLHLHCRPFTLPSPNLLPPFTPSHLQCTHHHHDFAYLSLSSAFSIPFSLPYCRTTTSLLFFPSKSIYNPLISHCHYHQVSFSFFF